MDPVSAEGTTQAVALHPWTLVLGSSPVVQAVLIVLVLMSLACWYIIGAKWMRLRAVTEKSREFLGAFWNTATGHRWNDKAMDALYGKFQLATDSPIATIFTAGYRELVRIAAAGVPTAGDIDNLERALRRAQNAEMMRLENKTTFLATTGSTAPFVGLFGTVWGVMNSFMAIAGESSARLEVVAPGIAEALIATAVGLAAAIPAVMGYNYFIRRIQLIEAEADAFSIDYLNMIRRHLLRE